MISFNKPPVTGKEIKYIQKAIGSPKISGDGIFTNKCHAWFENHLNCKKALLTTSCTHSLEMAALLINVEPGDEIIMPSYTFVSTANAFVLRGAKIVFVDIRPDTMNINEQLIEEAITNKTKAIVPVHYAGISCEMDSIMYIAKKHNLIVIEDAAQSMMSKYKNKYLGTIGHIGTFSFHESKNYTSGGEGGLLIINDEQFIDRSLIIREKGTNRSKFLQGVVDKYSWVDLGSSYLPNEISAAYLWAQLKAASKINKNRLKIWDLYYQLTAKLEKTGFIERPNIPLNCIHNGHMFYIKVKDEDTRKQLIDFLMLKKVWSVFHYIPLHTSKAGLMFGRFDGVDQWTSIESSRILRLPMYFNLKYKDLIHVCSCLEHFFSTAKNI